MLVFVRMSVLKEICLNTWLTQHAVQVHTNAWCCPHCRLPSEACYENYQPIIASPFPENQKILPRTKCLLEPSSSETQDSVAVSIATASSRRRRQMSARRRESAVPNNNKNKRERLHDVRGVRRREGQSGKQSGRKVTLERSLDGRLGSRGEE